MRFPSFTVYGVSSLRAVEAQREACRLLRFRIELAFDAKFGLENAVQLLVYDLTVVTFSLLVILQASTKGIGLRQRDLDPCGGACGACGGACGGANADRHDEGHELGDVVDPSPHGSVHNAFALAAPALRRVSP